MDESHELHPSTVARASRDRDTALVYHQNGTTLASYAWTYSDAGEPVLLEGTSNTDWTPNGGLPSEFVDQGMLPVHDTDGVVDAIASGGYAELSRLVSCTSLNGTVTYSYDPAGQLIAASYSDESIPDESYAYDANGNRVTANGYVHTTGAENRLLSDGTYWYDYDAEGNRVARYIDVNVNGILDSGDTDVTKYTWDARNRLIRVADYPVEDASPEQVVDYLHDLENRWIGKLIDSDGDGTVDQRTAFAYDGNQIVLQFEDDDLSHRYLWQPDAVDQLMADEQIEMDDVVWALTDHLGTIRDLALADPDTGETSVANHITYDSFGNKTSETTAVVDCLFGFTGRPFDEVTGLQNNLNRWYDGSTGQWMSRDPVGFAGRDANLYRYVANIPVSLTDPCGTDVPGDVQSALEALAAAEGWTPAQLAEAQKWLEDMLATAENAPQPTGLDRCWKWAAYVNGEIGRPPSDGIAVAVYGWYYPRLWSPFVGYLTHATVQIKIGDAVFYVDNGWWGDKPGKVYGPDKVSKRVKPLLAVPSKKPYTPPRIPGGWSVCFREGTQVHTESGLQGIETVSIGTKVWSYNHASETWNLMPVVDTEAHDFAGAMVTLRVGKDTIEATTTHPFWVVSGESLETRPSARTREGANHSSTGSGQWVAASDLQCGDVLLTRDGRLLAVGSTETAETKVRIHNLLVDRLNNYAVGNAGLLVNNM